MRKTVAATAAIAGLIAVAAPASAATIMAATGTPLTETIHNNHGLDNDSTLLNFDSDPVGYVVDYSSSSTLHYNGNSGGFAFVTGVNDQGFSNLTVSLEGGATFSAFKFNFDIPAKDGPVPTLPSGYKTTDYQFLTTVNFLGGGSENFTTDVGNGNGQNRYIITADLGEAISSIVFSLEGISTKNNNPSITSAFNFGGIRQASFDVMPGVPEPSTWAMFILGFGLIGTMLRLARVRQSATAA